MQYQCQVALEEKRPAAWAAVSLVRGAHHQVGGAVQTGEYAEPIPAIARFASAGGSLGHVAVERVRLARHDNGPVDQVYVSLLVWQTAVWCRWGQRGFPAGPPVALRPHNLSRIS